MAFEMKENTGTVFKNQKRTTENHPDRTGSANIGGVEYWVNGWVKQTKNGEQYLSLAFKRKEVQNKVEAEQVKPAKEIKYSTPLDNFDSDIPF